MMPSIILGLSALLLGATGQSQYRPGGSDDLEEGSFSGSSEYNSYGDYLDYQEQAQYNPGASSDYEYDYVNSIRGDAPVNQQKEDIDEINEGQYQYEEDNGSGIEIAGITGNVGSGINGDLETLSGGQFNTPGNGQISQGQIGTTSDKTDSLSGNSNSGFQNDQESVAENNASSGNKPFDFGSDGHKNQNNADNKEWNLAESIPGTAGDDYPIFTNVPETSFLCDGLVPGGYYADPEADCQSFHVCARDGHGGLKKFSFLCPNGTIFNQQVLVCDWWFNVDCSLTETFYSINEENAAEREANNVFGKKITKDTNEESIGQKPKLSLQEFGAPSTDNSKKSLFPTKNDSADENEQPNEQKDDNGIISIINGPKPAAADIEIKLAQNENKRIDKFIAEVRKNAQEGDSVRIGNTWQSQKSNINNENENNGLQNGERSGDSQEIVPLSEGYGAPGGKVLGSYS